MSDQIEKPRHNTGGLNYVQGLEVDSKIVKSEIKERTVSDNRYSPIIYSRAIIVLISAIVLGVIGAILRVVIVK